MAVTSPTVRTACPRTATTPAAWSCVDCAGRASHRPWRPGRPGQPGQALQEVLDGLQRRDARPEARLSAPLRRVGPKGEGRFSAVSWDDALAEIAERLDRSSPCRRPDGPERPLHGHLRDDRLSLPVAVLQPARRDRGRSGHGLQQGRARRSRVPLRDLARRIRSSRRTRRQLDPRLGSQPVGLRAPPARALAARGSRDGDRRRPVADRDGARGRSAPATSPGHRRRPRLRARCTCCGATGCWTRGSSTPTRSDSRKSAAAIGAARRHGPSEATASPAARSNEPPTLYGRGPSLLWIGQGFSASRWAATSCALWRCCLRSPATSAARAAGFLYLNGIETRGLDGDYLSGRHLARDDPP